ncbi:MAG: sigma-70 family RNA polymerase sigma factor [Planctomycetota bacterium]
MFTRSSADVVLAKAARRGDRAAIQELSTRLACVPGLVRGLHGRMGAPLRPDEREEVVQEILMALWAKLEHFDGSSTLDAWVYGFCSTQIVKFRERKQRRAAMTYGHDADQNVLLARNEELARLEFEWVHVALERLGPPADDIVRLKHFEELTFEEIGQRLSISPNTAKTHYYRALERLREVLARAWRNEQGEPA